MWKPLQALLLCCGLLGANAQGFSASPPATRPQVTSLALTLEDGRTYALKSDELADDRGGAIFWGDWAVYNILFPYAIFHRDPGLRPKDLVHLWNAPAHNGEQPAFLVRSGNKFCYPLNPAAQDASLHGATFRNKVVAITVGFADGRSYSLNDLELYDERSGVLFWHEHSVLNMLVPFYAMSKGLPTSPGDVIRLWHGGSNTAPQGRNAASPTFKQAAAPPGFLVKPLCMPRDPLAE